MEAKWSTGENGKALPFAQQNRDWRIQEGVKSIKGFMETWPQMYPTVEVALRGGIVADLTDDERAEVTARLANPDA
jgi:hypothetical protein